MFGTRRSELNYTLISGKMDFRLNQNSLIFSQKNQFRSPIDSAFPFAQSAMMRKIARRVIQAIFVDGVGRNSNRLPHDFGEESSMGAISHEGITLYEWTGKCTGEHPVTSRMEMHCQSY
jgi:hypothetical protein